MTYEIFDVENECVFEMYDERNKRYVKHVDKQTHALLHAMNAISEHINDMIVDDYNDAIDDFTRVRYVVDVIKRNNELYVTCTCMNTIYQTFIVRECRVDDIAQQYVNLCNV
jgi:hypothetical protein